MQECLFWKIHTQSFHRFFYHLVNEDSLVKRPVAVVGESSYHSIAALTSVDIVMQEMERHISLSKAILQSDVGASQFCSPFFFQLHANYRSDLIIKQHKYEAHYDKDPSDGIGDAIKNVVFQQCYFGVKLFIFIGGLKIFGEFF